MFSIFIASITASFSPARTAWPGCTATSTSRPGIGESRKLRQVRRRLERHQRVQLGGARRQHPRVDLRAVVRRCGSRSADALDLRAERPAVELAAARAMSRSGPAKRSIEVLAADASTRQLPSPSVTRHRRLAALALARRSSTTTKSSPICSSWPGSWPLMRAARSRHAPVRGGGQREQEVRVVVRHQRGREALRVLLGDEAGVEVAGDELRVRQQRRLERDVARDAADHEGVERLAHPARSPRRGRAPCTISLAIIES